MQKYICLIVLFLISFLSFSQKCLTDNYFNEKKKLDSSIEERLQKTIVDFNKKNSSGKTQTQKIASSNQIITIPVVFNVIHNGEAIGVGRNLSDEKIQEQIDILNQSYSGANGGVDTKIRFCLAKKDIWGTNTSGINRYYDFQINFEIMVTSTCNDPQPIFNLSMDSQIKGNSEVEFPPSLYLNVWVADIVQCGDQGILGYSSFPYTIGDINLDNLDDGIVVDYKYLGNNEDVASTGKTLVHEAGHWLGLFHTFEGDSCSTSCATDGDMICDTEAVPFPANAEANNYDPENCKGLNCDNQMTNAVQNYMDYAEDKCMKSFTNGQKTRMRDILLQYRLSIYNQGLTGINGTLTACGGEVLPGGAGTGCLDSPDDYSSQQIATNYDLDSDFASKIKVTDKWVITYDEFYGELLIYKKLGCAYSLHQSIDIALSSTGLNDLLLNNDEIIVSSYGSDSVSIFKYNEINDEWNLNQSIQNNSSSSQIGTGIKMVDKFLFVFENNSNSNNSLRIYYKLESGIYTFHQTLSSSVYDFPTTSKCSSAKNFIESDINVNSVNFTGVYDPLEILFAEYLEENNNNTIALLGLNSSNYWSILNYITPPSNIKNINDIEVTGEHAYLLSYERSVTGSIENFNVKLHTYKLRNNSQDPLNFSAHTETDAYWISRNTSNIGKPINSGNIEVLSDQFVIMSGTYSGYSDLLDEYGIKILKNSNYGTSALPNLQKLEIDSEEIKICAKTSIVFGNLIYSSQSLGILTVNGNISGVRGSNSLRVHDLEFALTETNHSTNYIENSNLFSRKICSVPENYYTFSERITIGESSEVKFNKVEKEFAAKESITLKSGTTISKDSNITFRVEEDICNSIISTASKTTRTTKTTAFDQSTSYDLEEIKEEDKIVVYPNPTTGLFTVKNLKEEAVIALEVYSLTDLSRVLISKQSFSSDKTLDINLSNFQTGIYLMRITLANNVVSYKKIIKK